MKKILFGVICFLTFFINVNALENLAPNSKSSILLETSTGKILYESNSHEKLPPASMTKIMSMLLIMEAIDNNKLSFDSDVLISENAANMGGSQVFLEAGETYKVKDLLKGIAIASGNDAVVAMAEKVGGTVENFVNMMNEKAKSFGMNDTNFKNCHGIDEDDHYTSSYDIALLSRALLLDYPEITKYTTIYMDSLRDRKI